MDQIDNHTMRFVFTLIGPAGFGLLLLSAVLAKIVAELWKELKESREKFIKSMDAVSIAINELTKLVNR